MHHSLSDRAMACSLQRVGFAWCCVEWPVLNSARVSWGLIC